MIFCRRVFSFNFRPSMPDHFNNYAGKYVRNEREYRDSLKRLSDDNTAQSGIPHSYVPLTRAEMMDPSVVGVTGESIDRDV
ncbi:MAG: hypothetical protein ACREBW_01510 [Candidatus Micrarchaeaceae archaeon]